MAENGNGIDVRKISIPVAIGVAILIASVSITGTVVLTRINDLGRIAAIEAKVLGNEVWTRNDQMIFCLELALANDGIKCPDPRRPVVAREAKVDRR